MEQIHDVLTSEPGPNPHVQSSAEQYLREVLGSDYRVNNGFLGNGHWYFRILYQWANLPQGIGVGKLVLNAETGAVIPLTQAQLEDIRAQAIEHCREATGVSGPTARRNIQGYLTNYVSLFAEADRPVYHDGNPPCWRATIFLRLRGQGRVCDLGTLAVNACTGEVMPPDNEQLQQMRDGVKNATGRAALATATTW